MKQRAWRAILWAAILIVGSGCNSVYTKAPVGESVVPLDAAKWDGTWYHGKGTMELEVVDAARGVVALAWIEKKQGVVTLQQREMEVRKSGAWVFGSIEDPKRPGHFTWARLKAREDEIIAWMPDAKKFADLVKSGVLPGRVEEKGDVVLGALAPAHMRAITSGRHGIPLHWEEPVVLMRLNN
jgi:hypothetical protein